MLAAKALPMSKPAAQAQNINTTTAINAPHAILTFSIISSPPV